MSSNILGWFEIPVADMDRAIKFYQTVFNIELAHQPFGELDMAWFPFTPNGSGAAGSLVYHKEFYKPSTDGTLVYLMSQTGDLSDELSRIEGAGGQVLVPKTLIAENYGYMAVFLDSEGNRVALHSEK